ncbi:MAG: YigZ family protein [Sphingobacteriales bacterium]|nr:MAG: YigZ family protein [Sphingobacteriales bacterium]
MDSFKYCTVSTTGEGEFRDRGSKFLAFAYPVTDASEVKARLQELKKLHPKAVHHCYAYRLGTDGTAFRANDDGEPSGSAGRPILGQIDSAGLTDVLVVVVRYFGGTLLGVPGLINAYKTVTAEALGKIPRTEKWIEEKVTLEFDYPVMSEVLYLLKQAEATIYSQELQLFCIVKAGIHAMHSGQYLARLSEIRGVRISK